MTEPHEVLIPLAERQHSVFTLQQALDCGFSRNQIRNQVRRRRWIRLQRGLFRLGGRPFDLLARLSASQKALPAAVVSHESAAHLHGLPGFGADVRAVVTTSHSSSRCDYAEVHRYAGITDDDVVTRKGLATTTVALTLFHLSSAVSETQVNALIDRALHRGLTAMPQLLALADHWTRWGRPRRGVMIRALERRADGYVPSESVLESAFDQLVIDHGLPTPTKQFRPPWLGPAGDRVDYAYEHDQIVIEVDGRAWHTREADFERDRERDRRAHLAGWMTLRYTWPEVTHRGHSVAAEIREVLSRSAIA